MGLKQLIKQQRLLASGAVDLELVLPGEPLIYSIKYSIGDRLRSVQFFRNEKWKSVLKSFFPSYYRTSVPVVVIVQFYVSPPDSVKIKHADLLKETVPAVHSFELCDYLLSFLEMLHHVLINSYRQVVKIDVEKFYSANPRTVFKFMKWDHYVNLQNNNTVYPESKGLSKDREELLLQSKREGNAKDPGVCEAIVRPRKWITKEEALVYWPPSGDSPLQDTRPVESASKKTRTAKLPASHKEARRGQPGEVPQ